MIQYKRPTSLRYPRPVVLSSADSSGLTGSTTSAARLMSWPSARKPNSSFVEISKFLEIQSLASFSVKVL